VHEGAGAKTGAFAVLFGAALVARLTASRCLAGQSEPQKLPPDFRRVSLRELAGRRRGGSAARLLLYMLAIQVSVQVSAPFFTPYMLGQLQLGYAEFMTLLGASFLGKMLALPLIGRVAQRMGPRRVLWVGGLGIIPLAALWLVPAGPYLFVYLLFAQLLSGALWACYEMGTFLLLFETIPAAERTSMLTLFNCANAAAIVGGAAVGGSLLAAMGSDRSAYMLVFLVSTGARLLTVALLSRVSAAEVTAVPVPVRTIAVRPSAGSIAPPMLPGIEQEQPSPAG
jgi:MFS family permease